jgi:hypothetical protein
MKKDAFNKFTLGFVLALSVMSVAAEVSMNPRPDSAAQAAPSSSDDLYWDLVDNQDVHVCHKNEDGTLDVAPACKTLFGDASTKSRKPSEVAKYVSDVDGIKVDGEYLLVLTGHPRRWVYSKVFKAMDNHQIMVVDRSGPENHLYWVYTRDVLRSIPEYAGLHVGDTVCVRNGSDETYLNGTQVKVTELFFNGLVGTYQPRSRLVQMALSLKEGEPRVLMEAADLVPCKN